MRPSRLTLVVLLAFGPLVGCKSCHQPASQPTSPDAASSVGGLSAEQAQKTFDCVSSSAWTSNPMTAS